MLGKASCCTCWPSLWPLLCLNFAANICCQAFFSSKGEVYGGSVAEPSLQSATIPGWQSDLDIVDGWQWLEQSWVVTPGLWPAPRPWQLQQTRPGSLRFAKHERNKPSTIIQVKRRRKEEAELLCGWSLYHINNW